MTANDGISYQWLMITYISFDFISSSFARQFLYLPSIYMLIREYSLILGKSILNMIYVSRSLLHIGRKQNIPQGQDWMMTDEERERGEGREGMNWENPWVTNNYSARNWQPFQGYWFPSLPRLSDTAMPERIIIIIICKSLHPRLNHSSSIDFRRGLDHQLPSQCAGWG